MVSVLEDNDTYAQAFCTSVRAHAHTHTRALLPNPHLSGNAVFVFLRHLIMKLLAVSTKTSRAGKSLGSEEAVGKRARTHVSSVTSGV